MTANERRLLRALAWVALAAASAIVTFLGLERAASARRTISNYGSTPMTESTENVVVLEARIAELREASRGEGRAEARPSLAEFAAEIRSRLESQGIVPLRYQIVGSKGSELVEFALDCPVEAFLRFLRPAGGEGLSLDVSSLSMRPSDPPGHAEIVIRLRYAE